ncbi:MAG: hypothetical protein ACKVON_03280 [Beijerinckiaceae bacterium]
MPDQAFGQVLRFSNCRGSAMIHDPHLSSSGNKPDDSDKNKHSAGDTLDQLIIRAHYLALDLRVAALDVDCVDPVITQLAADFLRYWAVEAGRCAKR